MGVSLDDYKWHSKGTSKELKNITKLFGLEGNLIVNFYTRFDFKIDKYNYELQFNYDFIMKKGFVGISSKKNMVAQSNTK